MSQFSSIEGILSTLGYRNEDLLNRSLTLKRVLQLKIPQFAAEPFCDAACIELSCKQLGLPFNRSMVLQELSAKTNKQDYVNLIKQCQALMAIKETVPLIDMLSLRAGGNNAKVSAYHLLSIFERQVVTKMPEQQRKLVDLSQPLYHGAAFLCVAQKLKVNTKIDKCCIFLLQHIKFIDESSYGR